LVAAAALTLVAAVRAGAGDCCCAHCGCDQPCQKVCRLVCEEKKVEIVCWGCKCEDFCLPKPSEPGCKHCEMVCGACDEPCDCTKPYAEPKRFVWFDWTPGCAKIHTKKKLMQKKETKTVPSYKWVVEDLCAGCESRCDCATIVAGANVSPPPPMVDALIDSREARLPIAQPAR
jgi:hypothetical protein